MLVFRQLFDPQSSTYTYLLGDRASGAAILIDPVFEQVRRDAALLGELGLNLVATLETHIHADHVTGAWLLKQRTGSKIMLSAASGAEGADRTLAQDDVIAFGRPRPSQADGYRGAGQSALRPAGQRGGKRAGRRRPGLGAAALQLCRGVGDRTAWPRRADRRTSGRGADPRCP